MSDKMQTIAYEKTMSDKNGRLFGRQVLTGIFVSLENRLKAILGQHVSSKLILAMKSSIIFMAFKKRLHRCWRRMFETVHVCHQFEMLMIDSLHSKSHQHHCS